MPYYALVRYSPNTLLFYFIGTQIPPFAAGKSMQCQFSQNHSATLTAFQSPQNDLRRYPKTTEDPSITCRIDKTYDENGNLLREDVRWNEKLPTHTDYSYTNGKPGKVSNYDEHDRLTDYTMYSYDETGLTVTLTTYAADGTLEETVVNTYDEYGNLLTNEHRNETMDRNGKTVYTYELIEPVNES